MHRALVLFTACVVVACNGKSASESHVAATGSAKGSATTTLASTDAAVTTTAKKAAPTKQQIAEFRKHMKAGWAAQKQHKWADATTEFEAATKILDGEQRALSELGWSAMNAGDYVKARKADNEAVSIALDPKVKASALYNLGMVQEKAGDKDGALRSFKTSLDLRPNKIVEAEVAKLGTADEADEPLCAAGMKPCDCVRLAYAAGDEADPSVPCEVNTAIKVPVPGFHAYHVGFESAGQDWLLDEHDQIVAQVGEDIDRMRSTESMTLTKAVVKTVGGHSLLWLETTSKGTSDYMDNENFDQGTNDAVYVTVCVIGDAKTPTHCVPTLPKSSHTTSDHTPIDETGEPTGKGTTSETNAETEITIADDGTLNVKLVKGAADWMQSDLGPHKLW